MDPSNPATSAKEVEPLQSIEIHLPQVTPKDEEPPAAGENNAKHGTRPRRNTKLNAFIRIMGLKWKQRAMKKKEAHDHARDVAGMMVLMRIKIMHYWSKFLLQQHQEWAINNMMM